MRNILIIAAGLMALAPVAANAATGPELIGARISTLGTGAEFGVKLSPNWSARAIINGFNYNYDTTSDGITYTGQLKLGSAGAQVDYRFTETGPFYVTAGLYANNNKIHATAAPAGPTQIGSVVYTPAQIGTITANGAFPSSAPYLGLGWRWAAGQVSFNLEAGAYLQGKPTVTMTSDGTLASNSAYQTELAKERQSLQDTLDSLATYPVVAFGVGYKF